MAEFKVKGNGAFITGIIKDEIETLKRRTRIGDQVVVEKELLDDEGNKTGRQKIRAIVLGKYPYIVTTDAGDFQWKQLAMWGNTGLRRE